MQHIASWQGGKIIWRSDAECFLNQLRQVAETQSLHERETGSSGLAKALESGSQIALFMRVGARSVAGVIVCLQWRSKERGATRLFNAFRQLLVFDGETEKAGEPNGLNGGCLRF